MKITWKHLAQRIDKMTKEQQATDVVVVLTRSDDVMHAREFISGWSEIGEDYLNIVDGTIDDEHPFLTIAF